MSVDAALRHIVRDEVRKVLEEERQRSAPAPAIPSEFLTVRAAAGIAGVHPATLRTWIHDGRLPTHRAGRHLRVLRGELEKLLRASAMSLEVRQ